MKGKHTSVIFLGFLFGFLSSFVAVGIVGYAHDMNLLCLGGLFTWHIITKLPYESDMNFFGDFTVVFFMAAFNGFIWALMASFTARGKNGWATLFAFVVICMLLGYFFVLEPESHRCMGSALHKGFARIKPQLQHFILSRNGTFSCVFTNGAGAKIMIIADELSIAGDMRCQHYTIERENFRYGKYHKVEQETIHQGENFRINATGCQRFEPDHAYTLRIAIPYEVNVSGSITRNAENGEIAGCVAY